MRSEGVRGGTARAHRLFVRIDFSWNGVFDSADLKDYGVGLHGEGNIGEVGRG